MTFGITLAPTFLNELIGIPQNVFKPVSKATKLLERDPISADGDAKKLKGYENVYRIRLGDYRLFYAIGTGWVKLLSVRKRNERTYETEIPTAIPPETTLHRQSVKPKKVSRPSLSTWESGNGAKALTTLPFTLTEEILQQWQIPSSYWAAIAKVSDAEALLELDMPDRFMNVTNGVTQRRWLLHCNPDLANLISSKIGFDWIVNFEEIGNLRKYASDPETQKAFLEIKRANQQRLIDFFSPICKEQYHFHDA